MQGRNWIVVGIAVVLGLFAVYIANAYFSGVEKQNERIAEQQRLVRIAVAAQPLQFGTPLTDQNVRMQAWPAASVPEGAFRSLPEALKNKRVALRPIVPGEPVLASKVSGTDGRATLAALLPEGMRAMSIPVSAVTGVSGFVLPGTMVDVILTRQIAGEGATDEDVRSDIILENVQVLAVDQIADDKKGEPKVGKTATLAVNLTDAQRLAIAQRIGTLSLVLRKVESADATVSGGEARYARTVTNRQLGGPRLFIAERRGRGSPQPAAPAFAAAAPQAARAAMPAVYRGATVTVFRGVEPTTYPVGNHWGW